MNAILNNPPTFLNAEEFANLGNGGVTNPEALDIFADLNWLGNNPQTIPADSQQPQPHQQPPLSPTPTPLPPLPPFQPTPSPTLPSSTVATNAVKKDIIKYLYNTGSCAYLQSCFAKLEDIDSVSDSVLYNKFKIGLIIDSVLGKNSSDKNLASYVFTFFEVLLNEAKKFTPADIQKYIEVFSMSLQKDKITILNDSGSNIIAKILSAKDLDEILNSVQDNDTPSMKALKSSLQNISLLLSLTLTKRLFSPYIASFFDDSQQQQQQQQPPAKRIKTQ